MSTDERRARAAMTPTELLAALEAATGPDRGLDYAIAAAVGWPDAPHSKQHARRYTESVDAALTLVPEGWMVELWLAQPTETKQWHANAVVYYERRKASRGEGATPALALCIAAIRARGEG